VLNYEIVRRSSLLLAATIVFAVLYLIAAAALGTTPGAGDDGPAVARWFQDNASHVRLWLWLLTLTLPVFALYAALVRDRLPAPHRDVFFFGAIALATETALQGWLWAGLAWHAGVLEPATARTLLDIASYWGPVLTSTAITMLAPVAILGLGRAAGVPLWLGVLTSVAVFEQVIETITIFGRRGFIAPGGPMNLYVGALLTLVALVGIGVALSRPATTPAISAPTAR
jgi:hypothetical protein